MATRSARHLSLSGVLLGALLAGNGCSDPEPPDTMRLEVVAVRAEPPTGAPGRVVDLELVHNAELLLSEPSASGDSANVRVAWFGGCHNPPSGQYYGCLPLLRAVAAELPDPLPDTLPAGAGPEGVFGLGTSFAMRIPDDILIETRAGPAGVSYAFFVACRGELRPRPDLSDTIPVGCFGADGQELGREDFAAGFATIRSVPGEENANPRVTGLLLDGAMLERGPCAVDGDCAVLASGSVSYGCSGAGECWPVIADCGSDATCGPRVLELVVDMASAEPLPAGSASRPNETLRAEVWSALVARNDSEEIYPGHGDVVRDIEFRVRPLPSDELSDEMLLPLLAVVRDSRGGTGWLEWSFLRAPAE